MMGRDHDKDHEMDGPMIARAQGVILEAYLQERLKYVACLSWKTRWKALKEGFGDNFKG